MLEQNTYKSPLSLRYASREMSHLFSSQFKYSTWRRLWTALAKAQKKLGLPISDRQIAQLEKAIETIDYDRALEYEKKTRHDVMAHILVYGEACPEAKKIIHLGATSTFVTDNADLIQMKEGLTLLQAKLVQVVRNLKDFATRYAALGCLGYTHLQPAQPTTVGKRACLWLQDLLYDFVDLNARLSDLRFLGVKGATGTAASFLSLFNGDDKKVKELDQLVAQEFGFDSVYTIAGQTYTRKQDMRITAVLSGLAASCHKFATDLRLLSHLEEIEEPFSSAQVGSSAMPYKRNPICSERICGLSRFLISLSENAPYTAATQWLERTLDDSSNRRLYLPEIFLSADAILNLMIDLSADLQVFPETIQKHLEKELLLLATENILMHAVKKGGDRQELHEKLRHYCSSYEKDKNFALWEQIAKDSAFHLSLAELKELGTISHFIGRASAQVEEFLENEVKPLLKPFHNVVPPHAAAEF